MDERNDQDFVEQDELERYGVWVKAGPEEVIEAEDDFAMTDLVTVDDLEIQEPEVDPDPFQTLGSESDTGSDEMDLDLDLDDDQDDDLDLDALQGSLDDDYEEIQIDEIETDATSNFDSSMPGSDDELEEINMDDLDTSFDDDLDSEDLPELESDSDPVAVPSMANTLSADEEEFLLDEDEEDSADDLQTGQISDIPFEMDHVEKDAFERIQNELSDIKRELTELRLALRQSPVSVPAEEPAPVQAPYSAPEEEITDDAATDELGAAGGSGFFEDEEDETIALTGDELDNILNTAEFTEEVGEAAELDEDFLLDPEDSSQDFEMEEVERTNLVIDGDESAVDELAEMNIDAELADIESLEDETTSEAIDSDDDIDEIELDLDSLDDLETEEVETELTLDASDEDDGEIEISLDDESVDELELDEEIEISLDETSEDELELDEDLELELEDDIELDDQNGDDEDEIEISLDEELEADDDDDDDDEIEINLDDESMEEVELDDQTDEDEEVEITLGESDDVLEIPAGDDDLELKDEDLELDAPAETDDDEEDDFEEFASAVENDLSEAVDGLDGSDDAVEDEPGESDLEVAEDLNSTEQPSGGHRSSIADLPEDLKQEIRAVLSYMDQLLEALPDDKIEEFAQSEHFEVYKHLFEELGLET